MTAIVDEYLGTGFKERITGCDVKVHKRSEDCVSLSRVLIDHSYLLFAKREDWCVEVGVEGARWMFAGFQTHRQRHTSISGQTSKSTERVNGSRTVYRRR